ncbi:tigger transposable element-derived protein 6-like [Rhopalosiphum maidis]|uniref:tigger transposable element-derived protein 6-like n=1 Tax=Rhopalosiphum maidis TaxID=43146 RepID=UPI000EFE221A|nr:tigger transposable element-derived protein 6-like [Rhopalosiphum maidis]
MTRRQFTLDEKIGIIGRLENGEKNNLIAKEFVTSSSTISTIWKSRDSLKNMLQTTPLQIKRMRTAQHKKLEEAVLIWFKQQRILNLPISGPILQTKTDQLAVKMKIENFKCSASWIQRFRQRHNIGFGKISSESSAVKDVMTSNNPDNDNDQLDGDFGTVPSISETRAALRTLEKFYYTKYEGTDDERKALVLLRNSVNRCRPIRTISKVRGAWERCPPY